jgi:hypothetical protein
MPRDRIVWLKPAAASPRAAFSLLSAAAEARTFGAGGEDPHAEMVRQGVPAHDPPLDPRDEAIFLLRTAAEVEHALLVQYLYAAFSLKQQGDGLTAERQALIDGQPAKPGWRDTLLFIAEEEMGHLMTVQNLLLLIGGPLNFEREHFPFLSEFYPFHFRLEPLTKESLAKYVLAEKPEGALPDHGLQKELMRRAGIDNQDMPVNRVGALYASLYCIFSTGGEPAEPSWFDCGLLTLGDDLPGCVRPPPPPKHLKDEDFVDVRLLPSQEGLERLGARGGASSFPHILVPKVRNRQEARGAIQAVAEQGEGAGVGAQSHFSRFLDIYKAFPETDARRGQVAWTATRAVPTNPNTFRCPPPEVADGTIVHQASHDLARLFNLRYRMLLSSLSHALQLDRVCAPEPVARAQFLADAALKQMTYVREIADQLTGMPQWSENAPARAAPPFELPYTVDLPARELDRWRWHADLLQLSLDAAQSLLQSKPPLPQDVADLLTKLLKADQKALQTVLRFMTNPPTPPPPPSGPPPPPPAGQPPETPMPTTSFAKDIRPLFRDIDVKHMLDYNLDLSDYQQVRDRSADILTRVKLTTARRMPPPPDPAWTADKIALFQKWVDEGYPK